MSESDNREPPSPQANGSTDPYLKSIEPTAKGINDLFLKYTAHLPSPSLFRLWVSLYAIGAGAERRVYTQMKAGRTYPNQYVFLVGAPNSGKSVAMNHMVNLVFYADPPPCVVGPDDLTKQGLYDSLNELGVRGKGLDTFLYYALFIREIGSFMPEYNLDLSGCLTDLWDCPDVIEERKRHQKKPLRLDFPGMSFLVCAATGALGGAIPKNGWDSGFMARSILVYSPHAAPPPSDVDAVFGRSEVDEGAANAIKAKLGELADLHGEMTWNAQAQKAYLDFLRDPEPGPAHHLLAGYNDRRPRHLCKLMMVSALAELRMTVTLQDFIHACTWMDITERDIPAMFSKMLVSDDERIAKDLALYVWNRCMEQQSQGFPRREWEVPRDELVKFLLPRTQPHRIASYILAAEESGWINRIPGYNDKFTIGTHP
jgi:hypothetical protein